MDESFLPKLIAEQLCGPLVGMLLPGQDNMVRIRFGSNAPYGKYDLDYAVLVRGTLVDLQSRSVV